MHIEVVFQLHTSTFSVIACLLDDLAGEDGLTMERIYAEINAV